MLTDTQAKNLPPKSRQVAVGGVAGLYLFPGTKRGTGKFIFRFVSPETGKRRDMGLGSYPAISIAEVRKSAWVARELVANQVDPIFDRTRKERHAKAENQIPTFRKVAEIVHGEIASSFKNKKHRAQWINS